MDPIKTDNLFGDCPKCGTVSNEVTTVIDYPGDPEPVVMLPCENCKELFNAFPEGTGYSDLLKRINPRTTKDRTQPLTPSEANRGASAFKFQYSPRQLRSRIPSSREDVLALRESLLKEARNNGTLKCMVCGKVPPAGDPFLCHFAVSPQQNAYFFTCGSTICQNTMRAELSRPERGNVGVGLQTGQKLYDQRKKPGSAGPED